MRPNKLKGLSLETLSSQVVEFEAKARANPIGLPFRFFFLGKLLVLPANVRLDWKVIARYKHSTLFGLVFCNEEKKFLTLTPGVSVINRFFIVIGGFNAKLARLLVPCNHFSLVYICE
jgi:hypothetical protein